MEILASDIENEKWKLENVNKQKREESLESGKYQVSVAQRRQVV